MIRRSLIESGCPSHIVQDLIENAHERKWPRGLATLETRQLNRRYYDDYVTKRIPGKQAVVVLQCENGHMPNDMISDPGIVMIFAHGVEDVWIYLKTATKDLKKKRNTFLLLCFEHFRSVSTSPIVDNPVLSP